jgi:cysteine desulfurase
MKFGKRKTIYLDHAAATPLDAHVLKSMIEGQKKFFANPSAIHSDGVLARIAIEDARKAIADSLFAHSDEIIFTGSGTESDALAIRGLVASYTGEALPHIVTTSIEHPAILENCKALEKEGKATVTYVGCDEEGRISPKEIKKALQKNTILVSVMYANNEIGTIEPIQEIAKEIRHFRKMNESSFPLFHTDAAQAVNYISIPNIEKLGVDMLSFNSSKIYGPKGLGVLYKKRGVVLAPLYGGGGQENGIRSGTENTASIIGARVALNRALDVQEKESSRLSVLRDYVIEKLKALSESSGYTIVLNGDPLNRLPNNINISISDISSELLVIELDARGIEVSAKSACKADDPEESHVIRALQIARGNALQPTDGSIRISMGRSTNKSDMDIFLNALGEILATYKKWKKS